MLDLPDNGLYRTTEAMPGNETSIPKDSLVFVGERPNGGGKFVVRPAQNRNNRWYWSEPATPLRSPSWARTLKRLPAEGFYTLPEPIEMQSGGKWLKNAIVQLGYNDKGQGILFVGERHESATENILRFSDKGMLIDDGMLERLIWAPILPVRNDN